MYKKGRITTHMKFVLLFSLFINFFNASKYSEPSLKKFFEALTKVSENEKQTDLYSIHCKEVQNWLLEENIPTKEYKRNAQTAENTEISKSHNFFDNLQSMLINSFEENIKHFFDNLEIHSKSNESHIIDKGDHNLKKYSMLLKILEEFEKDNFTNTDYRNLKDESFIAQHYIKIMLLKEMNDGTLNDLRMKYFVGTFTSECALNQKEQTNRKISEKNESHKSHDINASHISDWVFSEFFEDNKDRNQNKEFPESLNYIGMTRQQDILQCCEYRNFYFKIGDLLRFFENSDLNFFKNLLESKSKKVCHLDNENFFPLDIISIKILIQIISLKQKIEFKQCNEDIAKRLCNLLVEPLIYLLYYQRVPIPEENAFEFDDHCQIDNIKFGANNKIFFCVQCAFLNHFFYKSKSIKTFFNEINELYALLRDNNQDNDEPLK
ncbi:hypothetical protein EDEG_02327 [Edhazardia aedis USNM 41457]|uniref:Uncharacterized protein n=1 Tax=Edhazardia aedis (strain USNM 41457) TaxID=1003232 RepID=J8ZUH9_EDHAE|nr:hypothetical protein EDEG_02327 [Edhazardia aedis USNM 41457]|eukprot:EJW03333.1 hypothetical protein EDEG_02327 [Edhazardia aedis USNM 41457]